MDRLNKCTNVFLFVLPSAKCFLFFSTCSSSSPLVVENERIDERKDNWTVSFSYFIEEERENGQ